MALYQEIIFLQHWCKNAKWVIENVVSYYKPLIQPQEINNHFFWSNFYINPLPKESRNIKHYTGQVEDRALKMKIDIEKIEGTKQLKRKVINNCVEPETGLHIFQEAFREYKTLL